MRPTRLVASLSSALIVAAVLVLPATPARATFPGANGKIAFQYGDGNIYTINPDGTQLARLTNSSYTGEFTSPAWSPNGGRIVLRRWPSNAVYPEIYVMNADGTGMTQLTNNTVWDDLPAWSPDGSRITFTRVPAGGNADSEIFVMNTDGSGEQQLTDNEGVSDGLSAWSPDGTRIAFTTNRDGNQEIYVMNPDGSGQTNLTNFPAGDDREPAWSADGTKISFTSTRDGNEEIYVMKADGSGQQNLSAHPKDDRGPAWSPDGAKISFVSGRDLDGSCDNCGIYLMNSDGSGVVKLKTGAGAPDWQPLHLSLAVSRNKVTYRGLVTVTAHLLWYQSTNNLVVSIYKIPYGGAKTLVVAAAVDGNGNLSVNVALLKKTTFVAEWSGDEQRPGGGISEPRMVYVYAIVRGKLTAYYGSSGKYKLYHFTSNCPNFGKGCPTYTATVIPNHHGKYVYFTLQVYLNGAWRTALSFRLRLNSQSKRTAIFVYSNRKIIGIPTRVHARFKGDADHLGRTSVWSYFKVTP